MEEGKPTVVEKYEFHWQAMSLLIATFSIFVLSELQPGEKHPRFLNVFVFRK